MRIFVSYASQDRSAADEIRHALNAAGHDVFFDREDLPAGEEFHARIRRAIERADLMIFLISPNAVDAGSYTLNELQIAEQAWRHPAGRLLPVVLEPVELRQLPAFVRSVTFLETDGNVTAAVAHAVEQLARERRKRLRARALPVAAVVVAAAVGGAIFASREPPPTIVGKDGAPAVLVPAGPFVMGDDEVAPRREVYVSAFYIDRYEVTIARYAEFLASVGESYVPDGWEDASAASSDLPVVGVSWHDAAAYCRFAGKRLPTEAEWEKAARGTDKRRFPWGNASPTLEHANYQNAAPESYAGGLAPVGAHPLGRSPYGADDMAGNAAEWVADWYGEGFDVADAYDPPGPDDGEGRVIRGGGRFDPDYRIGVTQRYYASPDTRADDIGFRCATHR